MHNHLRPIPRFVCMGMVNPHAQEAFRSLRAATERAISRYWTELFGDSPFILVQCAFSRIFVKNRFILCISEAWQKYRHTSLTNRDFKLHSFLNNWNITLHELVEFISAPLLCIHSQSQCLKSGLTDTFSLFASNRS